MKTPFTEDQKRRILLQAVGAVLMGFALGFIISNAMGQKKIDKLEAKIFKLEGWQ